MLTAREALKLTTDRYAVDVQLQLDNIGRMVEAKAREGATQLRLTPPEAPWIMATCTDSVRGQVFKQGVIDGLKAQGYSAYFTHPTIGGRRVTDETALNISWLQPHIVEHAGG